MPRRKAAFEGMPEDDERQRQIEAGRAMMRSEGVDVFEDTREELQQTSVIAARRLRGIIESPDADSKTAVLACNSILDRTGHPPERKVRVTEDAAQHGELKSAMLELVEVIRSLPVESRIELRKLLSSPDVVEADVVEVS